MRFSRIQRLARHVLGRINQLADAFFPRWGSGTKEGLWMDPSTIGYYRESANNTSSRVWFTRPSLAKSSTWRKVFGFPGASFLQPSLMVIVSRKKAVYDSQRLANLGIELRWSLKVQLSGSNEVQTLAWWAYRDPLILAVFLVFHATKVRALFHWSSQPNEPERGLAVI